MFVKKNRDTALKVEFDGDFRVAFCISPLMAWSVLTQPLSKRSMRFGRTMVEQIPTYTNTVRSGGTVRGLAKAPYAWDWWSEIVLGSRVAQTRMLATNP